MVQMTNQASLVVLSLETLVDQRSLLAEIGGEEDFCGYIHLFTKMCAENSLNDPVSIISTLSGLCDCLG